MAWRQWWLHYRSIYASLDRHESGLLWLLKTMFLVPIIIFYTFYRAGGHRGCAFRSSVRLSYDFDDGEIDFSRTAMKPTSEDPVKNSWASEPIEYRYVQPFTPGGATGHGQAVVVFQVRELDILQIKARATLNAEIPSAAKISIFVQRVGTVKYSDISMCRG